MGGGQIISPKNGGSVDAIVNFWGECNSNVIFMGGVEIKLVDFGESVVPFYENLGGGKTFHQKSSRMGGGRYLFQKMWEFFFCWSKIYLHFLPNS